MNPSLTRARLRYGRELLKDYPDWVKEKKTLDRWIEGIVTSPGPSDTGRVQGGLPVYVQERLIERKEADPYYQRLCRDIERVQSLLREMTERQLFLIEMFHWKGRDWWELCKALDCEKTTLYRWIDEIDAAVAREWDGDNCESRE